MSPLPICRISVSSDGPDGKKTSRSNFYDVDEALRHIHRLGQRYVKQKKNWKCVDRENSVTAKGQEGSTNYEVRLRFSKFYR